MDKLKIGSQNFRNIRPDNYKIKQELENLDILLAQEIRWPQKENTNFIKNLEKELNCRIYKCNGINNQNLVTYVKNNIKGNFEVKFNILIHGRATNLNIANNEYNYNIVNTYGPADGNHTDFIPQYFDKIKKIKQ